MISLKKTAVCALAALLCAAALTGCADAGKGSGNSGSSKALEKVTLNEVAHSIFYAPMYVAIEEGYFEEEGIELELVTGFGADKTMTAVLTGEADIGFMGSESSIYTYVQGIDDPVVNFAQLTQRAGNFVVAREPIEDFDWSMLIGAEVLGGRAGGMPEMVFEYVLKKNGIVPEEVNIDKSIDFGSTAAAFSGGKGEYSVEFEPYATSLEVKGDGYIVASVGEASGYVPYTAFSATASYLEEHGDTVQGFVNALQKGLDYVNSHTAEEIAAVIGPQFEETEEESLVMIVERYAAQDTWPETLVFSQDSFELLEQILMEAGELEEMVSYEELVNTGFAETAAE
ncbi:MAG: ABC transporter substrate-binding protein [Lachnospiraceae bacterium]|nr:ABC transporter substrate-binding protein [Lachnospiraceae bacterium]